MAPVLQADGALGILEFLPRFGLPQVILLRQMSIRIPELARGGLGVFLTRGSPLTQLLSACARDHPVHLEFDNQYKPSSKTAAYLVVLLWVLRGVLAEDLDNLVAALDPHSRPRLLALRVL